MNKTKNKAKDNNNKIVSFGNDIHCRVSGSIFFYFPKVFSISFSLSRQRKQRPNKNDRRASLLCCCFFLHRNHSDIACFQSFSLCVCAFFFLSLFLLSNLIIRTQHQYAYFKVLVQASWKGESIIECVIFHEQNVCMNLRWMHGLYHAWLFCNRYKWTMELLK